MEEQITELINISRYFGGNREYAIAGGGNTSYKTGDLLWIKASGTQLATLQKDGLSLLDRKSLKQITSKQYSRDAQEREAQVKNDLIRAMIDPSGPRPSVETSLHDLIDYKYVIHLHHTLSNGMLCAWDSKKTAADLFGKEALYIDYTEAGYTLFKTVEKELTEYRRHHEHDPHVIFLENHGVFVSADDTQAIKDWYEKINHTIRTKVIDAPGLSDLPPDKRISDVMPAIRMMLTEKEPKILRYRHNQLIRHFYESSERFNRVSAPFSPDMIVYCKSKYLYIDHEGSTNDLLRYISGQISSFEKQTSYLPKVILIRNFGLIAAEDDFVSAETVMDIYMDLMKISYYTESFGGPRFLNKEQISFIENWEVENYRRKLAKSGGPGSSVRNKIALVTGAAQGFGAGISEHLFRMGANLVLADIKKEPGEQKCRELNQEANKNHAVFCTTDVSDDGSAQKMAEAAVREFGGLDLVVSNAGILHAGGLDELEPGQFDRMTQVNYAGYYKVTRSCAKVLKIQAAHKDDYHTDIIQINSKSGLKGSTKNFAYAGAKFGGVGLTQSFALELVPYRIKVNSVCPGNYFDGPLWSDPEHGLFVQYLKAGKVPGAKSLEDVRNHYEKQVPMHRGCSIEDVMKAILYVVDQEYETGQAIPVTGGQVMLH